MFRKMRRFKQEISQEDCKKVLNSARRGVLSVNGDDGYPFSIPMNFYYDEAENTIYFHGAKNGHKIDSIKACDKVCFTAMDEGYKNEGDWFWQLNSVVVFGRAELVEDRDFTEKMARLIGLKYYPTPESVEEEIARDISALQLIALHIEHMTGKHIKEK